MWQRDPVNSQLLVTIMPDETDDAEMRNVKLSINTVAMIIFDVWCCF